MPPHDPPNPRHDLRPLAALFAFILPGAGHLYNGRPARAALIAAGVLGLFAGGLLVGGIDAVDSRENQLWYYAQAMTGPLVIATDRLHQTRFKAYDPNGQAPRSGNPGEIRRTADPVTGRRIRPTWDQPRPGETPSLPNRKSVAKVNEIGTLYIALAGFMNLIAIIDALLPAVTTSPRHRRTA